MSSRSKLQVVDSPIYNPKSVPGSVDELPTFLSDELLNISSNINNILGGGLFKPTSRLPKRLKDGVTYLFLSPLPTAEDYNYPVILEGIEREGLHIFVRNKWYCITPPIDPAPPSKRLRYY